MTASRIAIVTGATSGIGEATARQLIQGGFAVVGTGRNSEKLKALEAELGKQFVGVAGDTTAPGVIDATLAAPVKHFGRAADVVVANAGRGLGGSVKDSDLNNFRTVLELNVTATLELLQKASRQMVESQKDNYPRQSADIVVIGSVVGRNISPFSAVYGATKFAVHALTEGLRREVGPLGVRVTLMEPGLVVSGFQDAAGYSDALVQGFHERFGPLLTGEDIARSIHFIVTQPPHVHVSDILVRPTRQDYP
jgi:NADP-dependent 3-hydroxy acid dehydrogenase YdfG